MTLKAVTKIVFIALLICTLAFKIQLAKAEEYPPIYMWIVASHTKVAIGNPVYIEVYVDNNSPDEITFTVSVYANLSLIASHIAVYMFPYSETVLHSTWDTTDFPEGTYTIWAHAMGEGWQSLSDEDFNPIVELTISYDVTIDAYCGIMHAPVSVSITKDGSPTGFSTPHTFTDLTGTHTFTVPSNDSHGMLGHPFAKWGTGETSTTLTVTDWATYKAYYAHSLPPVGGVWVPLDKFGLLAPYIGLASTIVVATVATAIYAKRVKRRKENR